MGLFGNDVHNDPVLGGFARRRGSWYGEITMAGFGRVPLVVPGDRHRPDTASLALVPGAAAQIATLRETIAHALYEHWAPYAEAGVDEAPALTAAADVWRYARIVALHVDASQVEFPLELRLTVPWDDEHTLGARVCDGELVELCGSV
jgi:hypothetical protein